MPAHEIQLGEKRQTDDWVAFDSSASFKDAESRSAQAVRNYKSSGLPSNYSPCNSSTASWMNKPIHNDSLWFPLAPPAFQRQEPNGIKGGGNFLAGTRNREQVGSESVHNRSTSQKPPQHSPMRDRNRLVVAGSENHSAVSVLNPASFSSDSSSLDSQDRATSRTRGRSIVENAPDSQQRRATSSSRSTDARKTRSTEPQQRKAMASARVNDPTGTSVSPDRERGRSSSRRRSMPSPRPRSNSSTRRIPLSSKTIQNSPRSRVASRPPVTYAPRGRCTVTTYPIPRERSLSKPRLANDCPPTVPSSNSVGPGLPPRSSKVNDENNAYVIDANIGRNISFGLAHVDDPLPSERSSSNRTGRVAGDQPGDRKNTRNGIHPRTLLSATVYHNVATNLWIATINFNQKGVPTNPEAASKYLKAFSFPTERQAHEYAIANAPPKMVPFSKTPTCFICSKDFSMFRRAGHCRNCGVCICSTCTTFWPSISIPQTYNIKKESKVKICLSCNKISVEFKQALLQGKYNDATDLYSTGNINLRVPFPARSKEESMLPVHCAVEGGKIEIVRWLIEEQFCPITKAVATKNKSSRTVEQPIQTSKGRTVLSIAMSALNVEIIQYLSIEQGVPVFEIKDLIVSLRALEAVLLALPRGSSSDRNIREGNNVLTAARWDEEMYSEREYNECSSLGEDESARFTAECDVSSIVSRTQSEQIATDVCIVCFDRSIDCVITPCGHQICCFQCTSGMKCCPECNSQCRFIKICRS